MSAAVTPQSRIIALLEMIDVERPFALHRNPPRDFVQLARELFSLQGDPAFTPLIDQLMLELLHEVPSFVHYRGQVACLSNPSAPIPMYFGNNVQDFFLRRSGWVMHQLFKELYPENQKHYLATRANRQIKERQ